MDLTKFGILDTFSVIRIVIAYKDPWTGEKTPSFSADQKLLEEEEVVYEEFEGRNTSTTVVTSYYGLLPNARKYIESIERYVGVKFGWIGTGPRRKDMIIRKA